MESEEENREALLASEPKRDNPESITRSGHKSRPPKAAWLFALGHTIVIATFVALSWYGASKNLPWEEQNEYGIITLRTGKCDVRSSMTAITFAINTAASLVILGSDHIRLGLMAPTPREYQARDYDLGVPAIQHTSVSRNLMALLLMLTSLPVHYLSNTIIFKFEPTYNSYETVVSTSFFDHASFDLNVLEMPKYNDSIPLVGFSGTEEWPADYKSAGTLETSLLQVQETPSLWRNLSRKTCIDTYNNAQVSKYRTVLIVTNYTTEPSNNSALAIGTIPGYRYASMKSSLRALCPDVYLERYNSTQRPSRAVSIPNPKPSSIPIKIQYIDPMTADQMALNNTYIVPNIKRQIYVNNPALMSSYNPLPSIQLCWPFWPDEEHNVLSLPPDKGAYTYIRPRADFLYCLAEPIKPEDRACHLVYSPYTLFIVAVVLSIKLPIFAIGLYKRFSNVAFYRWRDALAYSREEDKNVRIRYGDRSGGLSLFISLLSNLPIFILAWILWAAADGKVLGPNSHYPRSASDKTWFLKLVLFYRSINMLFAVALFSLKLYLDRRDSGKENREACEGYPATKADCLRDSIKEWFWDRTTGTTVRHFIVSTLLNVILTQLYPFTFVDVVPLGNAIGSLQDTAPVAFSSLATVYFKSADDRGFIYFCVVVALMAFPWLVHLILWGTNKFLAHLP